MLQGATCSVVENMVLIRQRVTEQDTWHNPRRVQHVPEHQHIPAQERGTKRWHPVWYLTQPLLPLTWDALHQVLPDPCQVRGL